MRRSDHETPTALSARPPVRSSARPPVRLLVCLLGALLGTHVGAARSAPADADSSPDTLSVGTWGGPYEAAQRAALFDPFSAASGTGVVTVPYHGGLALLEDDTPPDVIDMLEEDALVACETGLLRPLDGEAILGPIAPDALLPGSIFRCAVAHLTFSTLVAYDERAFPGRKPQRITDLFDIDRFPGKRALQRSPAALFEWAMMAEGVPTSQIYDLLSTERGMRLIGRRLDALRGHVLWWEKPGEAVALLTSGEAVMASGYNGRFFDAWRRGAPLNMIWDGQIVDRSVWALPAAATGDVARAEAFVRFAMDPERQARVARQIAYGPTHLAAFDYIGLHPEAGIAMNDHLPTAPHHLGNALYRDTRWYARTRAFRQRHFDALFGAPR